MKYYKRDETGLTQRNPIATATFTVIFYELVQPFFFHSIIEEFPYGIFFYEQTHSRFYHKFPRC
jgi:hypothetical protein